MLSKRSATAIRLAAVSLFALLAALALLTAPARATIVYQPPNSNVVEQNPTCQINLQIAGADYPDGSESLRFGSAPQRSRVECESGPGVTDSQSRCRR